MDGSPGRSARPLLLHFHSRQHSDTQHSILSISSCLVTFLSFSVELLERGLASLHNSVDRYKHAAAYKAAEQSAKDKVGSFFFDCCALLPGSSIFA